MRRAENCRQEGLEKQLSGTPQSVDLGLCQYFKAKADKIGPITNVRSAHRGAQCCSVNVQIVAACTLDKGQEIFNTFGELENTDLVCKYGFALPNNPFNAVHLDKDVLGQEAQALGTFDPFIKRKRYLAFTR